MKIKVGEIQGLVEGLKSIIEEKLPAKASYWLARDASKLSRELQTFEQTRLKIVEKYCKRDKKGEPIIDKENNQYDMADMVAFQKEFRTIMDEEIEIDLKTIALSELGDVKIKPLDLIKLEKIIKEN